MSSARLVTIATSDFRFSASDVFGVAVLQALHPDAVVIRTQDLALIATADYAVGVGGVWDDEEARYDFHQAGFDGARESGVPFTSAGLIWLSFGLAYIQRQMPSLSEVQALRLKAAIDSKLVQHLDASDAPGADAAPGYSSFFAVVAQLAPPPANKPGTPAEAAPGAELLAFTQAARIVHALLVAIVRSEAEVTLSPSPDASALLAHVLARGVPMERDGRYRCFGEPSLTWWPSPLEALRASIRNGF